MNVTAYVYPSAKGPFWIVLRKTGRWHVLWEIEDLGSYHSGQAAVNNLAGGHTHWPTCGDPSQFGFPSDLADWEPVERAVL